MGALPGSGDLLGPVILLLLLATAALVVGLVPRWRDRMTWGRGADRYRVSRRGCLGATAAFLVMAAGPGAERAGLVEAPVGFWILLAGFLLFLVVGLLDRPRR